MKLDDENMQAIIAKAVLDSITPERREEMLSEAVKSLLAKPANPGSYGEKRSVLQVAFDSAVSDVARKIIADDLATSKEFRAQVESMFAAVSQRIFAGETGDRLIQKMADAIVQNLREY